MRYNFSTSKTGLIFSSERVGNKLYLSGSFSILNGLPRQGIACMDLTTGEMTSFAPTCDGVCRLLKYTDSNAGRDKIVAYGTFTSLDGKCWGIGIIDPLDDSITQVFLSNQIGPVIQRITCEYSYSKQVLFVLYQTGNKIKYMTDYGIQNIDTIDLSTLTNTTGVFLPSITSILPSQFMIEGICVDESTNSLGINVMPYSGTLIGTTLSDGTVLTHNYIMKFDISGSVATYDSTWCSALVAAEASAGVYSLGYTGVVPLTLSSKIFAGNGKFWIQYRLQNFIAPGSHGVRCPLFSIDCTSAALNYDIAVTSGGFQGSNNILNVSFVSGNIYITGNFGYVYNNNLGIEWVRQHFVIINDSTKTPISDLKDLREAISVTGYYSFKGPYLADVGGICPIFSDSENMYVFVKNVRQYGDISALAKQNIYDDYFVLNPDGTQKQTEFSVF
jgi:hypothetical protein